MPEVKLKQQNWAEFDKLFEKPEENNTLLAVSPKEIKKLFSNPDDITDGQRKMIIAIFTNELDWEPEHSFNFILKVIPGMKKRLTRETIEEHKLDFVYNKLTKKEASKLINILKSISGRKNGTKNNK